jgi:hypothetical protein
MTDAEMEAVLKRFQHAAASPDPDVRLIFKAAQEGARNIARRRHVRAEKKAKGIGKK